MSGASQDRPAASSPRPPRVILGVCGGIAAYKAATVLRHLTESGHDVTVVPTEAALRFVGEPTWSALSGHPARAQVWQQAHEVPHVRLGQHADLVVVAPATANLLAKAACGLADDLLTNTLLTARCPVLVVPAMHTEMWLHPATQANVRTLRARGVSVMEPASGRLTGADSGPGRLPEPEDIVVQCRRLLAHAALAGSSRLAGRHVVITAGGTREPVDPVRFLGNRSSGKQGLALADVALGLGAQVTLICANVALPTPVGARVIQAETALDLREAVLAAADGADVVVMAAAVADFRPASIANAKIKKSLGGDDAPTIELVRNPDILAELVAWRRARDGAPGRVPVIVGFAAETGDHHGDVLHHARAKLARKGCDLLVANEVGVDVTFGKDHTTVHILAADSDQVGHAGPGTKHDAAAAVWRAVDERLPARR